MTNLDIINFGAKLPYVQCILIGKTSLNLSGRFSLDWMKEQRNRKMRYIWTQSFEKVICCIN
jgi:hypothetical protein